MGATVSVAKRAAAFTAEDGTVGYALFEATYEKNSYPHNHRWSCSALGTRDEVLRAIFQSASSFEGSMLFSTAGERSTEGYISAWLAELEVPMVFPNVDIPLRFGTDWEATIYANDCYGKDRRGLVLAALQAAGHTTAAATIGAGETYRATLYRDFDLLRTLFSIKQGRTEPVCPQWRTLKHEDMWASFATSLGMQRPKLLARATVTIPSLLRINVPQYGFFNVLVQQPAGHYECSRFSFVNEQIRTSVAEYEITSPGSYDANIKALRAAVRNAPDVERSARIEYDLSWAAPESLGWVSRDFDAAAKAMGVEGRHFSTTWGDVIDKNATASHPLAWQMLRLQCDRWFPTGTCDLFSDQMSSQTEEAA